MRQIVEKRVFGYMNQDDSDKDLENGAVREIHNMIHAKDGFGNYRRLQVIRGTSERSITMPSGTNTELGAIEDIENEKLYYFNYNSLGLHGVYEYDPAELGSVTKLIESIYFPFTAGTTIRGVIIDGMLFFTAGAVPMYINVAFAKIPSGQFDVNGLPGYRLGTIKELTYAKPVPDTIITPIRVDEAAVIINRVAHDSYKFSYRFVFFDNGRSRITHYSTLVEADLVPPISETANNAIQITLSIDWNIEHLIKSIEFVYQKNDTGGVFLFETVDRPKTVDGWDLLDNNQPVVQFNFDASKSNIVIPTQELLDPFDNIPRETSDIIAKNNRLLMNKGLFGHNDTGSPDLNLTSVVQAGSVASAKHGGIYSAGVFYEDANGWRSPILVKQNIQIPYFQSAGASQRGIRATITGLAPDWAVRWYLAFSEERLYNLYEEFPVYVMPVIAKSPDNLTDGDVFAEGTIAENFTLGGYLYYTKNSSDGFIQTLGISAIHLRMPENLPFYPEKGMFGRFKSSFYQADDDLKKEFVIIDVVGDKIYIDAFGVVDPWLALSREYVNVEIYSKKDIVTGIYHEVGISGPVTPGLQHLDNVVIWSGDQFYIDTNVNKRLSYLFNIDPIINEGFFLDFFGSTLPHAEEAVVYSPSPTSGGSVIIKLGRATIGVWGVRLIATTDGGDLVAPQDSYTLDYSKIANDRGLPNTEADIEEIRAGDVILNSDQYLPNTLINGLFNIGLLSEETLGAEDGNAVRMFSIGDRTILVIHGHTTTSMYVGQGVLRTVDGQDILTKSDKFIGYTNRNKRRLGSTNPESMVLNKDDQVYFWDASRGEIGRYGQDGMTPLGKENAFKGYLKVIADNRRIVPGGYKAYGMYNQEHEMYILSFPDASFGQISIPAITVAYSERAGKFVDFFAPFSPEGGHSISDKLVVFDQGRLFRWNQGGYKFFDNDFFPKIVLVFNNFSDVQKLALNWVIDSDKPWRIDIQSSSGSESYTDIDEFVESEKNKHYGDIYRDVSSSGAYPDEGSGGSRFNGDTIRGEYFIVTLSRDVAEAATITELLFAWAPVNGHISAFNRSLNYEIRSRG